MNLIAWGIKWGVPFEAIQDLQRGMGQVDTEPESVSRDTSEAEVQADVRFEACEKGGRLWRNNVGALPDKTGRLVRYGLCNDTEAMNKRVKSSDLIGIRPCKVMEADVGHTFGMFVARECKEFGWTYSGTEHEKAQLKFIEMVIGLGGDAGFVCGRGEA